MSDRAIVVITSGLSAPSSSRMLADRLSAHVMALLGDEGVDATVRTFELRDYAREVTDNLLAGFAPPRLAGVISAVETADAVIAVTPIFATSYSGLFKSFVDILDPEALVGTPVLLGATGGTARHSLAIDYSIRPLFVHLHAEPVTTGVFAASSDWGSAADDVAPLSARIERGAGELVAAVLSRTPDVAADPYDPRQYLGDENSFEHFLGKSARE